MTESTPEDASREIERLWARVGEASAERAAASPAPAAAVELMGAEAAWEAVGLLKRQRRQREAGWQQALAVRDEALRQLGLRLAESRAELTQLHGLISGENDQSRADALEAGRLVEEARAALASGAEERRLLGEALQSLRERLAAENARAQAAESGWQEREERLQAALKEMQALVERREAEAALARAQARSLRAELAQAQEALERTLGEFLQERRANRDELPGRTGTSA